MDKKKVIARIEQLRIEKGISVYQLKENADISSTYISMEEKRDERQKQNSVIEVNRKNLRLFGGIAFLFLCV